jgi:hypothetical protein
MYLRISWQRGGQLRDKAVTHLEELVGEANTSGLTLLFSLAHNFPSEQHRFITGAGNENFLATVKRDYFPYFTPDKKITIDAIQLSAVKAQEIQSTVPQVLYPAALDVLTQKLNGRGK